MTLTMTVTMDQRWQQDLETLRINNVGSQKLFGEGRYLKCGGVDKTTELLFIKLELPVPGCLCQKVPFI